MNDFERFTGANLGGAREFHFALMSDIQTLPTTTNGTCNSAVLFKDGKRWLKAYSTPETIDVKEKPKKHKAGRLWQLAVSGFYPKQTPQALANLVQMDKRRFAVKVIDNNGYEKLFLNLKFSFTPVSQKSVKKRAGYSLNFALDATKPASFYPF